MGNQIKYKIISLIISIIAIAICILLYFMDKSLEWNTEKIISCVIVSTWIFFIPPTILYYVYKIKNSNIEYSTKLGLSIGTNGFLGILLAPIIGTRAYFINLENVKYTGFYFE